VKMLGRTRQTAVTFALLCSLCHGCSWAVGYFHQVTAIRGRVVGSSWARLRWLRQSFSVDNATLTLYEYRFPAPIERLRKVAVTRTDSHGDFDFGSVPNGHYLLSIEVKDSNRMGDLFDVEVTDATKGTKSITIDVSPVTPDCRGGHEFLETKL
jgi:hypothetical protein